MPIQNVGTLIESMAVAESASVLLDRACAPKSLVFATAFAMPVLSEWRPHSQAVGVSATALRQVAEGRGGSDFVDIMKACLQRFPDQGPNAALLVSLLASSRRRRLRIWANDIVDGHYGSAILSFAQIEDRVRDILPGSSPTIELAVCDLAYPSSLTNLRTTLDASSEVGAVLGFLDPMRYVRDRRESSQTSSADHREWLGILKNRGPSLVVQFTGNRDSERLASELEGLREDLKQSAFAHWLEVRRQHYVVSVGSQDITLLDDLETKITRSWRAWCDTVSEIVTRELTTVRSSASPRQTG